MGIASDTRGRIWVSDTGNNRVQKWTQGAIRSEIATEITFDGKAVSSSQTSCSSSTCSLSPEWTLESKTKSSGPHTLAVKATDGLGRSTTKTLAIELQPDTTKPTVQVSGALYEAPAGWVEQESYGINIASSDAGAGVTSLVLKLDGQAVVSQTQACAEGGCGATSTKSINMSSYAGGAHSAEVVATDGAGNVTTKTWTLNVDPDGHITAAEATDTLEAADTTAESSVVAPTSEVLEPEQIEHGLNPALHQVGSEIVSSGTPDPTKMTTNPGAGFTIKSPEGTTEITPNVSKESSGVAISEGVAGVSANIGNQVDSVIRPEYNGVQIFEAIRSDESPEKYSWTVHLAPKQSLRLANPGQAEVYYPDGTIAFLITAEPAHDATGHSVPTSLEVSGNVLTLKVEFKAGTFVYPVVAGQGWETSYLSPVIIEGPEDEAEILQREREEREQEQRELEAEWAGQPPPAPPATISHALAERYVAFGGYEDPEVTLPPYPPPGSATASDVRYFQIYKSKCGHSCDWWKAKVYNATYIRHYESAEWEHGTQVHASVSQDWKFEATIFTTTWNCGAVGPKWVHKGSGEHLIAYAHFTIETPWVPPPGETMFPAENNFGMQVWVYPNGFQEKHINSWDGQPTSQECPTVARP